MSWTDFDEGTWEYQAGKMLKQYQCDGPYRKIGATYQELFDSDQFDALARKAMGELNPKRNNLAPWTIDNQVDLLASKQHDYGHGNIVKFGPHGVRVRLWDKIARYNNLIARGGTAENEPIQDTLIDMVGYCVIYGMVKAGTFSFPLAADKGD